LQSYEETEQTAIEVKRKRLHYESIRIEEVKKDVKLAKDKVTLKMKAIEDKVYEDTRPQQVEKQAVEDKIHAVEAEIEEIERMLDKKRKEREQLVIDRQIQDTLIDKSRTKYRD
jgi:hypothetical protein